MIARYRERIVLRWIVAVALLIGLVERIAWAALHDPYERAETYQVAHSLALGRGFADALGNGQPTAHLTPSLVLLGGLVYRLLGFRTAAAESVLMVAALATVAGVFFLCFHLFRSVGLGRRWAVGALCFLLVFPLYTSVEAIDFRLWEGALASLLSCVCLCLLIRHDQRPSGPGPSAMIGLVLATTFLVSPTVGAATYVAWLIWVVRNRAQQGVGSPLLLGAGALLLVLAPWTVRKEVVLNHFIPTRDNLGLEMSLSYYDGADKVDDNVVTYWRRLHDVHPFNSPVGQIRMSRAGGEIPYNQRLLRETKDWIARHPAAAAMISIRHIVQYVVPPTWQFIAPNIGALGPVRWIVVDTVGVVGLLGVSLALVESRTGRGGRLYLAMPAILLPLAYMLVHPIPRYMWLDYPFLVFWSAMFGQRLTSALRDRRRAGTPALAIQTV